MSVHRLPEALVVSPQHSAGPIQLPLRSTRRFTAVAEAADSTPIPEARITWELADTAVASFDRATGVLTPKALGTTTLTARLAGIQPAVWTVQVIPGDIELQPARVGLGARPAHDLERAHEGRARGHSRPGHRSSVELRPARRRGGRGMAV